LDDDRQFAGYRVTIGSAAPGKRGSPVPGEAGKRDEEMQKPG